MIPVTYPSSVSTSKESQMVVYSLSSVAGLQRWTDYIPVKYQSTGSDVPNSFNTNGYIACDFITNLTGKQAWVDYIPVFVDNLATTAWQVSDTGFIPFNTLAGGGTYVSLDLNFLNTTALDSRITFSRGTNATLTDSNGRIAWAPHNLLTNSESFEASAWTRIATCTVSANTTTAPDATTTADTINFPAVGDGIYQSTGLTSIGVTYTASVWLWATTPGTVTVKSPGAGAGTIIASVTTTPTRFSITYTATVANEGIYILRDTAGQMTSLFAWGAQLNVGSTAQSYNSTTPKNLLGYTQEPENAAWTKSNSYVQQNLLTWSQDFDNAAWGKSGSGTGSAPVVTANAAIAPDGSQTAELVVFNRGAGNASADQSILSQASIPTTISANYAGSFYVKAATASDIGKQLAFRHVVAAGYLVITLTADWQRITRTEAAGGVSSSFDIANRGTFTADNTVSAHLWGAQLVQGSTAGDYTQTTSAAAPTRYLNWDGTLTGRKLVEDTAAATTHRILNSVGVTVPTNGAAANIVYAKAGERTAVRLTDNDIQGADFDLLTGAVSNIGSGVTAAATSVGGGWWRLSVIRTNSTGTGRVVLYLISGGTITYTGDGTSGIYVSDFQLSNSASVDPYVYNPQAAAASAAYYGPRFDYDPVTLAPRGLLIEEQRTNLLTYSNDWSNAAWVRTNVTITGAATLSPDGTVNASKIESTATGSGVYNSAVVAATSATASVYLKQGTGATIANGIGLRNNTTATNLIVGTLDYSTGVFTYTTGSTGVVVTNVGNGWWRVSLTATAGITSGDTLRFYTGLIGAASTSGDFCYGYGAQLEAGSFATSYIPTVASQVTRNADSASMLGDNFYTWYNPNQGTLSAEAIAYVGTTSNRYYELSDGTPGNLIQGFAGPSTIYTEWVYVGGIPQAQLSSSGVPTTLTKIAVAYKQNDFAASLNGAAPATDTSGSIPPINKLNIGSSFNGTGNLNGTIRRIGYYNTRLPDSTLQAMTT